MSKLIYPTDEEEAQINAGIEQDPDNPEWTEEMFRNAKPSKEVFAELGMEMPKPVGRPPEMAPKTQVTIRLDQDIIAHFKGDDPKGWQTRINAALRKLAGLD